RFDTGVVGTWRWTLATGWSLLSSSRPEVLQTDAAGEFVGVYNTYIAPDQRGSWRWSPTSGWARLSTAFSSMALSANGTVFEDRGDNGIWRLAPGSSTFTRIRSTGFASDTLYALPDGSLYINAYNGTGSKPQFSGYYWNPNLPAGVGFARVIDDTSN